MPAAKDDCAVSDGPACETVRALKSRVHATETVISAKLDALSDAVKDLKPLATELVRMRGDHDRLSDAVVRIGKQVDRQDQRLDQHAELLQSIAVSGAELRPSVKKNEQMIRWVIGIAAALIGGGGVGAFKGFGL